MWTKFVSGDISSVKKIIIMAAGWYIICFENEQNQVKEITRFPPGEMLTTA